MFFKVKDMQSDNLQSINVGWFFGLCFSTKRRSFMRIETIAKL